MINETQLRDFFCQFLLERGLTITPQEINDFNFIASASIDSFEILSMIIELEMLSGVHLTPEELMEPSNATVHGLIQTLLAKQ